MKVVAGILVNQDTHAYLHVMSVCLRRWEVTSSVNAYRIFMVSRPRVQNARLDEYEIEFTQERRGKSNL